MLRKMPNTRNAAILSVFVFVLALASVASVEAACSYVCRNVSCESIGIPTTGPTDHTGWIYSPHRTYQSLYALVNDGVIKNSQYTVNQWTCAINPACVPGNSGMFQEGTQAYGQLGPKFTFTIYYLCDDPNSPY